MAKDDYSYLHTAADRYLSTMSLASLETKLEQAGFFRIHRRYLVNLSRVKEVAPMYGGTLLLTLTDEAATQIPGLAAPRPGAQEGARSVGVPAGLAVPTLGRSHLRHSRTTRPPCRRGSRRYERILHAGDVGRPEVLWELQTIAPVLAVRGNVDFWELPGEELASLARITLLGHRITVVHNRARPAQGCWR